MKIPETFEEAALTDSTVQNGLSAKIGAEAIILLLVQQKVQLLDEVIALGMIAPKAYRVDGKVLVWRCPDELIPIKDL